MVQHPFSTHCRADENNHTHEEERPPEFDIPDQLDEPLEVRKCFPHEALRCSSPPVLEHGQPMSSDSDSLVDV